MAESRTVVLLGLAAFLAGCRGDGASPPTTTTTSTTSTTLPAPAPGVHDHTPHHGGVVGMAGDIHLEAVAAADGRIDLYLTDFWRRPLPLAGVEGTVTVERPEGDREIALRLADDRFVATGPPPADAEVTAHFALRVDGKPVDMDFALPLAAERLGAAGVPLRGCVAVAPGPQGGRAPRCALDFGAPVTAVVATPDGRTLLVAAVDRGVSAWRMPAGELVLGFAPPPPLVVPGAEGLARHREAANALVVSPDGTAAVEAIEGRLLRYEVATGRFVRILPAPRGVLRQVAWSPDGAALLVTAFYDTAAHHIAADDGGERGTLPVEREAAAVAFAPDGRRAAVGSDLGPVTLFALSGASPLHTLAAGPGAALRMAFAGDRLLAAGTDGVLRAWEADGSVAWTTPLAARLAHLALAPGGRVVATGGLDGVVELHDVASGARLESLVWHGTGILDLTWAGSVLVSADGAGRVAFWDVADRLAANR